MYAFPSFINYMSYLDGDIPSKMFCTSTNFEILRIARTTKYLNNMVKCVNILLMQKEKQGSECNHIIWYRRWNRRRNKVVNVTISFDHRERCLGNILRYFIRFQIQLTNLLSFFCCKYFCICVCYICIYNVLYICIYII